MSYHLRLPPALLDLTLARASARLEPIFFLPVRFGTFGNGFVRRHMHEGAPDLGGALQHFPDVGMINHSLYAARQKPGDSVARPSRHEAHLAALEEYAQSLKNNIKSEDTIEDEAFSENDLLSVYEDLLAFPETPGTTEASATPEIDDTKILQSLARKLSDQSKISPLQVESLSQEATQSLSDLVTLRDRSIVCYALIDHLRHIMNTLEEHKTSSNTKNDNDVSSILPTEEEWSALVRTCVAEQDSQTAETVLTLIKRTGMTVPENAQNEVLSLYAKEGDIQNADRFVHEFLDVAPSARQRDLHIKAHIVSSPPHTLPTSALTLLHKYEMASPALPPPQQTYTRLISKLFSVHESTAEAQAWDLFAHMRYVAHPTPDAVLYSTMIRACANPIFSPQPERALDLFTEMTVDKNIPPTEEAYTAAILACARSGRKSYVNEAFRLAKQMLDGHRNAYGSSAFHPSRRLFAALLEGAKRVGDLARARWILAETIRAGKGGEEMKEVTVDDKVMMHVFHAYASYKPPFVRSATVIVDGEKKAVEVGAIDTQSSSSLSPEVENDASTGLPVDLEEGSSFSHLPPQSREELIREVKTLFSRILEDTGAVPNDANGAEADADLPFKDVRLTPRLFNAYLSVHYAHSSLRTAQEVYNSIFSQYGVEKTAITYVDALERCAKAKKADRPLALKWAGEIWSEWQTVEKAFREASAKGAETRLSARLVERAHTAMIRLYSITGQLALALAHTKAFAQAYPPAPVAQPVPKDPLRSTRTVLVGARPLVRLTSTAEVPDDHVPPLLTFTELEILHHKLVAAGDRAGITYVKWLCKAYEGALRRRRDATMRAEPNESKAVEAGGGQ